MTSATDRICNGWNKVEPAILTGLNCLALCKYGMLGLHAIGKYSRVADFRRLVHLQLSLAPVVGIFYARHLYDQRRYHIQTMNLRISQAANTGFILQQGLDFTVLLHSINLLPIGKWGLVLDRAAHVIYGLSVAAMAGVSIDKCNRNQHGDRISWFNSKEQIKKNLVILLSHGSSIMLCGLQAVNGSYSLNFAAARALIGCPVILRSIWLSTSSVKATWCPTKPHKNIAYD